MAAAAETSQLRATALDHGRSNASHGLPDNAALGGRGIERGGCDQTAGFLSPSLNSSVALRFSVGNGVILTIATGASLEQEQVGTAAVAQSSPTTSGDAPACDERTHGGYSEGIYEHGTIAWTGSTIWAAAVPLARHLISLDVRVMTGKDWEGTSVCELGYAHQFSLVAQHPI